MAERPKARVEMVDFPGIVTAVDPRDMPPGAALEQVNMQSSKIGQLETRPGFRPVTFDED